MSAGPEKAWAIVSRDDHIWGYTIRRTRSEVIAAFDGGRYSWRWWRRKHGLRVARVIISLAPAPTPSDKEGGHE